MKKISWKIWCVMLLISFCLSCSQPDGHRTSIQLSESGHNYKMLAHFTSKKMNEVDDYMDYKIGKASNMSFENAKIDAKLSLDDHTTFYMKKYPGYLEIKFDKDENSVASYNKIKSMCEGLKNVISK